jgi:hypothetical protein
MHWILFCAFQIISFTAALLDPLGDLDASPRFFRDFCGTDYPSKDLRDEHKRLSAGNARRVKVDGNVEQSPPIQIETWFHIISTINQANLVTDEMILSQVSTNNHTLLMVRKLLNARLTGYSLPIFNKHMPVQAYHISLLESIVGSMTPGLAMVMTWR